MDLQSLSETSKESLRENVQNSPPTHSIYLSAINVSKSGHRKLLRSSTSNGNAKEKLKQSTVIKNERTEASKK